MSDVLSLILSLDISVKHVFILTHRISLFLESFCVIFPASFIPKMHFLLHLPDFVRFLGPPVYFSSLRFEDFHQFFKSFSNNAGYKNILLYLSNRSILSSALLFNDPFSPGSYSPFQIKLDFSKPLKDFSYTNSHSFSFYSCCTFNSLKHRRGDVVCLRCSMSDDELDAYEIFACGSCDCCETFHLCLLYTSPSPRD